MKILQIGTFDTRGGAARVSYALKKNIEKRGGESPMFVHKKYSSDDNIFEIPQTALEQKLSYFFATDIDFYNSDWILNKKEFLEADIVQLHNLHGNFFNLRTLKRIAEKKSVVWTLHDMWAITGHNIWGYDKITQQINSSIHQIEETPTLKWNNTKHLFNLKSKLYQDINIVINPVSFWLKKELEKSILGNQRIEVIYNGINNKVFRQYNKINSRKELGLPINKKIITFLSNGGKNNPQKGWAYTDEIITKMTRREEVVFLCIGGNNYDKDKRNNIIYIPYINETKKIAKYYSASDMFLFTSLAENFPLVTLEAMACGTPVVSFDVAGVKEALDHKKNGYLAKYKDIDDVLRGIEFILNLTRENINKISNFSIKKINDHFTEEIMTDNYEKLYQSIIQGKI